MRVAIVGGSIAGLAAAILLAREGHEVSVFDRDDTRPADDVEAAAGGAWRPGAPHSPQGHGLPGLGRRLLRYRWPDIYGALLEHGAVEGRSADYMPATIRDRSPRPGDDELSALGSRRSTFEWIWRQAARFEEGLTIRHVAAVEGLVAEDGSIPRIRGVRVAGVGIVNADLVVDACGRRSRVPDWLEAVGARRPAFEFGECALIYNTRHYQLRPGHVAPERQPGQGAVIATILPYAVALLFPSDNDTVQLSIGSLAEDRPMKAARHAAAFDAFARCIPALGPWLEVLEPISGVWSMSAPRNVLRHDVVDGTPVAVGLLAAGDAVCNTNPSFGRGMSLALAQAAALADVLAAHPTDEHARALALHETITREIEPWYHDQVAQDDVRVATARAAVFGTPKPAPVRIGGGFTLIEVFAAAAVDAAVWRAITRRAMMLDGPTTMFDDTAMVERVSAALATGAKPPQPSVPSREDVLRAIEAAVRA